MQKEYDVIVVGAGHAGCEASLAAARLGCSTLLVTFAIDKIGFMSCNPAIGGVGKGQLVKEVDALGGEMGRAIDATMVQFRMLNASRGYAARSSRAQADRVKYNAYMREVVLKEPNLEVLEDEVMRILIESSTAKGIETKKHGAIKSKTVILTPGTFTNGVIHIGLTHFKGGRISESASFELSKDLARLGFNMMRLSTCTTPRLDGKTIDFSKLEVQEGDSQIIPFSFWTEKIEVKQKPCFMARTNERTHKIIRDNIKSSVFYSGKLRSSGVRYCPSIEDKIMRFADKPSHILFIEPEGFDTDEYYANGIFTAFPREVQEDIVHSIEGLRKAEFTKPGYGIEYDVVDPTGLKPTLETKSVGNLFLAGQLIGTTGYEEAAALGITAGINGALKAMGKKPLVLDRSDAYIGVLIDDLVTKGTREPYRMFTSRVEHRLVIREDNAQTRLGKIGYSIGLLLWEKFSKIEKEKEKIESIKKKLREIKINPNKKINEILKSKSSQAPLATPVTLYQLLKRPGISLDDVMEMGGLEDKALSYRQKTQIEVDIRYEGYVRKERAFINKLGKIEKVCIPENFDFFKVEGLSGEIKEKLAKLRPGSLGQASRVSGVTPVAIALLMVKLHAEKGRR